MATHSKKPSVDGHDEIKWPFGPRNYLVFGLAMIVIVIGYVALGYGSITMAPVLLVLGYCVLIPVAIIIGREIVISALREWMAEIGKRTNVKVSYMAKVKTTLQMLAIFLLLLYRPPMSELFLYLGVALLYVAALLTLWSMVTYLKAAWSDLTLSLKN